MERRSRKQGHCVRHHGPKAPTMPLCVHILIDVHTVLARGPQHDATWPLTSRTRKMSLARVNCKLTHGPAEHAVWSSPFLQSKLPLACSTPLLDGRGQNGMCIPAMLHHREPGPRAEGCFSFALTKQLPPSSQLRWVSARRMHSESGGSS